jgi:hypothetical protein
MNKMMVLGTTAIFVALGGVEANAGNPNVPSWSPYAIMGYDATHPTMKFEPMIEGRSSYTNENLEGPLNDYYKGVGLSDNPEDCNRGCAVSNGG